MLPILHQSYWRDEAFSVLLASKNIKDIILLTIKDVHPPLYYLLLHFWIRLFGDAEYVTRTLSLFFLFLTALVSFFLLKHLLKNWKIALMGSVSIMLNPIMIEYAFETRAYMFFTFSLLTAVLFYLKRKYFLSSIFLVFMVLTHNFSVFFLIAFLAYWFYLYKESLLKNILQFIALFGLPILAFLGWLVFLWQQWVEVASGFWIEPKTSSIFVETFRVFFQGVKDYPTKGMLYNLTLALVFIAFSYWIVQRIKKEQDKSQKDKSEVLLLATLFSIPFLIVYIISTFWVPIYHERFMLPILPLFVIWVVYSLYKLSQKDKLLSYVICSLGVAYLLFALQSAEAIISKSTKAPINYAVNEVLAKARTGDVIIPETNLNFLEIKYYLKKSQANIPVYAYDPDGRIVFYIGSVLFENEEIVKEYPQDKRVWVITQDGNHYLKTEGP